MASEKRQFNLPEAEEGILKFWERNKIFETSLKKNKGKKTFVFYEGPPTANGMPGIHHMEARAFKDAIPRYKTMRGFFVPRKAGWDTHGLPVEIQVEKGLGFKTKQDIENYGIGKFNAKAKESVWRYKEEWERFTKRMGYWTDLKNPYITYETSYIETLWWVIKEFYKKGFLHEDFKVVPWCPRCQTGLSSHEVGLGYKEVEDTAVYVKFKLEPNQKIGNFTTDDKTYILAWTTTPWTLPGNVGLAVKEDLIYVEIKSETTVLSSSRGLSEGVFPGTYILPIDIAWDAMTRGDHPLSNVLRTLLDSRPKPGMSKEEFFQDYPRVKGSDLVRLRYRPLFNIPEFQKSETAYKIYAADFVSAEEGTGVVHTAVMYGEDDYQLGKKVGLPTFHTVDETGHFIGSLQDGLAGLYVKSKGTEEKIIASLEKRNLLFAKEPYKHEYPHCWRCGTALLYYARKAWWVKTSVVKKELLANNEQINWIPEHVKHGRFGEFLRDVRDWAFSRERYWGTPLPIWKCRKCEIVEVIGSQEELKKRSGTLPRDEKREINLHRPYVDEVIFSCKKCNGTMRRVPEIADVWFDSGAMPLAQSHYPFNKKEKLAFPADYICEAVDQTRGWFYTLLAVSTLLGRGPSYRNVISLGHVLDKNGQKMSKSKGNVVNPGEMMEKYGADTLRWYFYTINGPGEPKRFDEGDLQLKLRGFVMTLWNSFLLFDTYVKKVPAATRKPGKLSMLDQWIFARLDQLISEVTNAMDHYDLVSAGRAIEEFVVSDFSQWYLRRSRRRLQHPESSKESYAVAQTTAEVLLTLCKVLAPFAPFLSEALYQELRKKMPLKEKSVHLADWPRVSSKFRVQSSKLLGDMEIVRHAVAEALKLRADAGIKVRQPLRELIIANQESKGKKELLDLIRNEVNVKEVAFGGEMKLDTTITPELREEGMVREFVRAVQDMRRDMGLKPQKAVRVQITGSAMAEAIFTKWQERIKKDVNAKAFTIGGKKIFKAERELALDQEKLWIGVS